LEYIFDFNSQLSKKDKENSKKADIIEREITEWLKLLVKNLNMCTENSVMYLEKLQAEQAQRRFQKKYRTFTTKLVSDL